jgi:hypothetical protein
MTQWPNEFKFQYLCSIITSSQKMVELARMSLLESIQRTVIFIKLRIFDSLCPCMGHHLEVASITRWLREILHNPHQAAIDKALIRMERLKWAYIIGHTQRKGSNNLARNLKTGKSG